MSIKNSPTADHTLSMGLPAHSLVRPHSRIKQVCFICLYGWFVTYRLDPACNRSANLLDDMRALDRNYVRALDLSAGGSHQRTSDVLDIEFDVSYLVPEGIMARNGCWTAKSVCPTRVRRRQRRSPLRLRRASSPRLSGSTELSVFNQRQQNPGCQNEMKHTVVTLLSFCLVILSETPGI
jgi:hypothetical protein